LLSLRPLDITSNGADLCLFIVNQEDKAMRKMILLMLLAIPLMGGAALAASVSGTVSSVNTRTGIVQLSNGATYYLADRVELSTLHPGDIVRIQYQRQTGARVASDIVKTGRTEAKVPVITPTRGAAPAVRDNFTGNSKMCAPTPTNRNPCYNIGGQ
jgi:hypothetical protein